MEDTSLEYNTEKSLLQQNEELSKIEATFSQQKKEELSKIEATLSQQEKEKLVKTIIQMRHLKF